MRKIIGGNWKLNGNKALINNFLDTFSKLTQLEYVECDYFIALPSPYISFLDQNVIDIGAQNVFYLDVGPYTGEVR